MKLTGSGLWYACLAQFQLSAAIHLETNLTTEKLQQRFGLAVWNARCLLPEIGTWTVGTTGDAAVDLDNATFTAIQTVEEAQKWIDETAVIVQDGTTAEELTILTTNHTIEPAGKQFRVYLVTNARQGSPAIIVNASHVLSGHRIAAQLCTIVQALVDARLVSLLQAEPDPRAALRSIFVPENLARLIGKLPISLNTAYHKRFNPTEGDLENGFEKLSERLANSALPSIGIPRLSSPATNPEYSLGTVNGEAMTIMNLRRTIGSNEYRLLIDAHKKLGITVPSVIYACIVNSIDRRCKSNTAQDAETPGANLAYSAHAKRWLPDETFMTRSPVNMAIVLGSAYVSPDELRSKQHGCDLSIDELIELAKTIRAKQDAYLDTPHIISAMEQVGDEVSAMIADTAIKQRQAGTDPHVALFENSPAICPPTLTSQGDIAFKRLYTAQGGSWDPEPAVAAGEYVYIGHSWNSGRTTDASVCFALVGFSGELRLTSYFDSRFFDAKLIESILDDVLSNLRMIATTVPVDAPEAKL